MPVRSRITEQHYGVLVRYVISGVTRGIGALVAERLRSLGHEVYGVVRPGSGAVSGLSGVAEVDLAHPESVRSAVAELVATCGPIDGLVPGAGIVRGSTLAATTAAELAEQYAVNVGSVAELVQAFVPGLRSAGGTIVFLNSMSGLHPRTPLGGYGASKWALRSYAETVRLEEPEIRVSSIYPGRVATDMQREVRTLEGAGYEPDDYLRPETIADLVVTMLLLPADGVILDLSIRPRRPPRTS